MPRLLEVTLSRNDLDGCLRHVVPFHVDSAQVCAV